LAQGHLHQVGYSGLTPKNRRLEAALDAAFFFRFFIRPYRENTSMEHILKQYGELLATVDHWFASCIARCGEITCGSGCSECCRGLFDITLLDGWYLKYGFDTLNNSNKAAVLAKAEERRAVLQAAWPEFTAPYILNYRPEEEWEQLMPDDDETPCPLLADNGTCLVYDYRPMTCRLHGLPLVDISGEVLHDEWCTRNFACINPLELRRLRWHFTRLFRDELQIFRTFTGAIFKQTFNELDTFIPTALLVDYQNFDWHSWLRDVNLSHQNFPNCTE
jgi:Fe-S-cluster containining protein